MAGSISLGDDHNGPLELSDHLRVSAVANATISLSRESIVFKVALIILILQTSSQRFASYHCSLAQL